MRVLAMEDVLLFLDELRLDPARRSVLSSGSELLRAAAIAGLVEEWGQFNEFIPRMVDLRDAGLVEWQPAPYDRWGDDILNAGYFKLSAEGLRQARDLATLPSRLRPAGVEELLEEHSWTAALEELREGDRQFEQGHWVDAIGDYYTAVESGLKYLLEGAGVSHGSGDALRALARCAADSDLIPTNYQALIGHLDSIRSPREHGRGTAPAEAQPGQAEALLMGNHARSLLLYLAQKSTPR